LQEAVLVGFSTGGGEVARYIGRHGTKRAKAKANCPVPKPFKADITLHAQPV
jgi:non-heme chloroperoxidase